jgi:flagellar basal-body rod protein FlgB
MMSMNLDAIPLFAMLKGRLNYLGDREKVLSENIANASTPAYVAHDLKPFAFQAAMQQQAGAMPAGALAQTQAMHMPLSKRQARAAGAARPKDGVDTEVTLDGNAVVLEEQMIKLNESQMSYDAAITFYQKSMTLLRMASRAPGK